MKTKIAIAALFAAAVFLTPAHAGLVLLTTTLPTTPPALGKTANLNLANLPTYPGGGASGYIIASGYDSLFPSTSVKPPVFGGATPVNLAVATDGGGVQGLGLATGTDHPYIGPSNGLLLNFSNVKTTLGGGSIYQINFNLYKDITGGSNWEIFGTNSNTTAGWAGATLIASGAMAHTGTLPVQTNSIFTYYAIGLESDCAIDLRNVQVEYATPEPGTFAMLGIGAVAVLILRKKLTGRRG